MDPRRGAPTKLAGLLCIGAAAAGATLGVLGTWPDAVILVPVAIVPIVMAAMAGLLALVLLGLWLLGPPLWRSPAVPVARHRPPVTRRVIVLPEPVGGELGGIARSRPNPAARRN